MQLSSSRKRAPLILRLFLAVLLATLSAMGGLLLLLVIWERIMHHPRFQGRLVQWNKRVLNPWALKYVGHNAGAYAALTHVGRRSGQLYTTPVAVKPLGDGFVIPLPYGADVDWCRNVRAAGHCEILWNEEIYLMERPELISLSAARKAFPSFAVMLYTLGDIKQYLWLHQHKEGVEPGATPETTPQPAPTPSA